MSQQRGKQIVELVITWVSEREAQGDYLEYEQKGKINRSALCTELGFARSAFQTNPDLVKAIVDAETRWFGKPIQDPKSLKAAAERSEKRASSINADNSKLAEEIVRLKAENNLLRRQLEKYKAMDEIIQSTGLLRP